MAKRKRRKKVTPRQKLQATHKKIDQIFEKKKNKSISVKSQVNKKHAGKGNSFLSYEKYVSQSKALLNALQVNDLKYVTPDRITRYVNMEIEAFRAGDVSAAARLNVRLSALKSLQQGIKETNILGLNVKKDIDFGDIQDYRDVVKENNVFRAKKNSGWKVPSNREIRTVKDRLKKRYNDSSDPIDKLAYNYVRYAQITGCRPSNGLSVRDKDITINLDGTATVIHYKDKGSLTRQITVYDKNSVAFLGDLKEGSDRGKLFQGYKQDGKPMSNDTLVKRIRGRVRDASSDLVDTKSVTVKGNRDKFPKETRITLHSIRKNFATIRVIELYDYFRRSPGETEKRMKDVINEMGKKEPKVIDRYEGLVRKQNRRNKNKVVRMLSVEETAIFLASCELGHFRTDVIKDSYLDQESWEKIKNKFQ